VRSPTRIGDLRFLPAPIGRTTLLDESRRSTAASIQDEILAKNPDLASITGSLFSAYSLDRQFILQARGERYGAATWRSFAQDEQNPEARKVFLDCAVLEEEESAAFLESISGGQA